MVGYVAQAVSSSAASTMSEVGITILVSVAAGSLSHIVARSLARAHNTSAPLSRTHLSPSRWYLSVGLFIVTISEVTAMFGTHTTLATSVAVVKGGHAAAAAVSTIVGVVTGYAAGADEVASAMSVVEPESESEGEEEEPLAKALNCGGRLPRHAKATAQQNKDQQEQEKASSKAVNAMLKEDRRLENVKKLADVSGRRGSERAATASSSPAAPPAAAAKKRKVSSSTSAPVEQATDTATQQAHVNPNPVSSLPTDAAQFVPPFNQQQQQGGGGDTSGVPFWYVQQHLVQQQQQGGGGDTSGVPFGYVQQKQSKQGGDGDTSDMSLENDSSDEFGGGTSSDEEQQ